jgi:hypothetical protein
MFGSVLITLAGLAHAEPTRVFVAPFAPTHPEAAGLATMLPDFMGQQLDARREITVVSLGELGNIGDVSALEYASSCPEGEFVGCAFILSESANAKLVLTGQITAYDNNTLVEVYVMETSTSAELINFQVRYGPGDDLVFAEGIARVVQAVIRGDITQSADIRGMLQTGAIGPDIEQASADLSQLDQEIGGVNTIDEREEGIVARDEYTMDDFAADMDSEGTKPWERLDMSPREYLRYKNSGRPIYEWRELASGRKSQLMIRPGIGFGQFPTDTTYYARAALSAQTLELAEVYAWQSAQTASNAFGSISVGYGLTPSLEVSFQVGLAGANFTLDAHRITEGDFSSASAPETRPARSLHAGPQVLYAFMPTSSFRPIAGGFMSIWRSSSIEDHFVPLDYLPNGDPSLDPFLPPTAVLAGGIAGVEVKMGEQLDLWLHIPIGATVATFNAPSTYESGSGILEELDDPSTPNIASAAIQIGIQVRMLGPRERQATLDDY